MKNETCYEWTSEEIDENGDIQNSDFSEDLKGLLCFHEQSHDLGLVRNVGNDEDGLLDRSWAYVLPDGSLDTHFRDVDGKPQVKVPKRFLKEFGRFRLTFPASRV